MNSEIEKQGDIVSDLFRKENEARLEFDLGKKRGQVAEQTMHKEIQKMKRKLTALQEENQQLNFANFERIQELIDNQENKMIEKQNLMHMHANCLELILTILKESSLVDICPYSSLINITPIDDEFFQMIPQGRKDVKSENLEVEIQKCQKQKNGKNSFD